MNLFHLQFPLFGFLVGALSYKEKGHLETIYEDLILVN